jgi:ribonuclease D
MKLIDTSAELAAACERLKHHGYVTVDTEFLRETTFWPRLCVIQMASLEEAIAVDALAPDIDLGPFFELMTNTSVVKVFHSARQDIEIIWHLGEVIPAPLFDTQVAAMVCGFGDQVSYEQLAGSLAAAKIDKSSRFTDWSRRPLSDSQIDYAIADVTHLRTIYEKLIARLEKNNRLGWLDEEMAILSSPETYRQEPERAWERLKTRVRKPRDLAVLMEVAAWREREAQMRDVPRSRVLKDDTIGDIALAAPRTVEELGRLRTIPQGFERSRTGADILAAVERALSRDPSTLPPVDRDRPNGNTGAIVQLLKVLLQSTAENRGVASKIIATVDDLEAIAQSDNADVASLKGWRRELFGEHALALKHGRLSLGIEKGRVVAVSKALE